MPSAAGDVSGTKPQQEAALLRLMIEAVRDYAIFMLDPEGRVMSWNAGAQRLKGYRAEEIIGRSFETFYTDADRARGHPQDELRLAVREGVYEEQGFRVRKDGTRFWANVVITPVFEGGQHLGFIKVTRDFTERREAEERLRQSEARLRLLLESVKDYAIFMLDPDGRIATWNPGAESIKGYTAAEAIGRHFSIFYTPEDAAAGRPARELQIARAEGRYEEEGWRLRKDGQRIWANVILTAVHDETGQLRGFAKVTRDLTRQRALEREAREAEARVVHERARAVEAQAAVKARDEFLSIAAHELRTPLTSLQLKLQGAQSLQEQAPVSPRLTDRLAGAARQVERLSELVERLLDVSRITGGRLQIRRERLELVALVRHTVEEFQDPARQNACELRVHAAGAIDGSWDRGRLAQAVVNLLSNAIKYGAGKPVDVTVEADAHRARVAVADSGIGIAAGDLDRIFGRFERAVAVDNYGGLGLGLFITRQIVEAHGGSISVSSEPGAGARFVIDLPREPVVLQAAMAVR